MAADRPDREQGLDAPNNGHDPAGDARDNAHGVSASEAGFEGVPDAAMLDVPQGGRTNQAQALAGADAGLCEAADDADLAKAAKVLEEHLQRVEELRGKHAELIALRGALEGQLAAGQAEAFALLDQHQSQLQALCDASASLDEALAQRRQIVETIEATGDDQGEQLAALFDQADAIETEISAHATTFDEAVMALRETETAIVDLTDNLQPVTEELQSFAEQTQAHIAALQSAGAMHGQLSANSPEAALAEADVVSMAKATFKEFDPSWLEQFGSADALFTGLTQEFLPVTREIGLMTLGHFESIVTDGFEGCIKGNYATNPSGFTVAGHMICGEAPLLSFILDTRDAIADFQQGNYLFGILGFAPFLGGLVRGLRHSDEAIDGAQTLMRGGDNAADAGKGASKGDTVASNGDDVAGAGKSSEGASDASKQGDGVTTSADDGGAKEPPGNEVTTGGTPEGPKKKKDGEEPKKEADRGSTKDFHFEDPKNPEKGILASVDDNGVLTTMIEAGEGASVRGTEMFAKAMRHFGGNVKGIRGAWTYGDNLSAVNKLVKEGKSLEEAVSMTWTARRARDHGFTKARIETATPDGKGGYSKVYVVFEQ